MKIYEYGHWTLVGITGHYFVVGVGSNYLGKLDPRADENFWCPGHQNNINDIVSFVSEPYLNPKYQWRAWHYTHGKSKYFGDIGTIIGIR